LCFSTWYLNFSVFNRSLLVHASPIKVIDSCGESQWSHWVAVAPLCSILRICYVDNHIFWGQMIAFYVFLFSLYGFSYTLFQFFRISGIIQREVRRVNNLDLLMIPERKCLLFHH
jgi:hypothetical protein